MKRDMDLIRDLLLAIERDPSFDAQSAIPCFDPNGFGLAKDRTTQEVSYHLNMLIDSGHLDGKRTSIAPVVRGITMKGHDFLDSIRDPEVWMQTKDIARKAGGFSLELLGDLAKGLLKTQIKRLTGVEL